jgi:lipopolysaccharide/colanic/teichoic acid biosynthesis glycosyltransferase/O-antigen ligase
MPDVALDAFPLRVSTTAAGQRHDRVERRIDVALGLWLFLFPLLPTGPSYIGVAATWWPEAAVLALGGLALVVRLSHAAPDGSTGWSREAQLVSWGYRYWIVAVTGAAVVGLATENAFGWTAFAFHLGDLPARMFQPINQAQDPLYPARVWLTMVEGAVAFWLMTFMLTRSRCPRRRARVALGGCLAGTALVAIIAVVQYQTGIGLHPYWVFMNPDLTRSHATLEDPNALGSFLLLGVGVALAVARSTPRGWAGRRRRLAAVGIVSLGLIALATTVSRAAWAAGPLAALAVVALMPERPISTSAGRRARLAARFATVGFAALVVGWLGARTFLATHPVTPPTTAWQAFVQTMDPRTPMADVLKNRHLMWAAAVHAFAEAPVLGAGLGRFPRLYGDGSHGQPPENAHNFFLQTAAEAGLVGLLSLGLLLGSIAVALWPHMRARSRRAHGFASGLAIGLLAWLLTSLTGHPLLTVSNQVWLGCVLAAGCAVLQVTPASRAAPRTVCGPRPRGLRLKRALDWTLASVILLCCLPLLVLIALAIRLDSPGPVLFRHHRITSTSGRANRHVQSGEHATRVFSLLKFRTMWHGVDPYAASPIASDDPRVTRVGRVLRRTCLDELPQLWNVVRGDLSLVGPRPEMPWIVQTYDEKARRRLHVQPGITGLWQLRGRRDRSIHQDIRWDFVYLRKRSLALDIAILLETIRFVAGGRNH